MDLYGSLFRSVLYPLWERGVRRRPTLSYLTALESSQWNSLDELTALQTKALKRLVGHVYWNVPFYRARFEAAGLHPDDVRTLDDLRKIPVMTRQEARRSPVERTSRVPPFPTIKKTTGGTTGEPLLFGYEPDSEHWRQAVKMRGYEWAGHRLGDHAIHYWGFPTKPLPPLRKRIKIQLDRYVRRDYYVDCTRRGDAELRKVVDAIKADKPSLLVCYTQAGGDLARFINSHGLRTWGTIPVICGAERVFAHDREALSEAFGPAVFETYGCREVMLIASECEAHDGLHESMENVLVEILVHENGRTREAEPGEIGEVVLTDLHNFGMPFLRYANGDLATAGPRSVCSCGRALRRITSIEGRTTETLRDGDGARVSGLVFNLIFSVLASTVRQFQAVQHKDGSITLKVVPTAALDETALGHIRQNCHKYLKGIDVSIVPVGEIPVSRSGKRMPVLVEQ